MHQTAAAKAAAGLNLVLTDKPGHMDPAAAGRVNTRAATGKVKAANPIGSRAEPLAMVNAVATCSKEPAPTAKAAFGSMVAEETGNKALEATGSRVEETWQQGSQQQHPLQFGNAGNQQVQIGQLTPCDYNTKRISFGGDIDIEIDVSSIHCQAFTDAGNNSLIGNSFGYDQACDFNGPTQVRSILARCLDA